MIVWFSVWAVIGLVVWYGLYLEKINNPPEQMKELDDDVVTVDMHYDVDEILQWSHVIAKSK